jgi:hypothetical protein
MKRTPPAETPSPAISRNLAQARVMVAGEQPLDSLLPITERRVGPWQSVNRSIGSGIVVIQFLSFRDTFGSHVAGGDSMPDATFDFAWRNTFKSA